MPGGRALAEVPKQTGARTSAGLQAVTPKLDDLGVTKIESSRWQAVASIPEEWFERHLAEEQAAKGDQDMQSRVDLMAEQIVAGVVAGGNHLALAGGTRGCCRWPDGAGGLGGGATGQPTVGASTV